MTWRKGLSHLSNGWEYCQCGSSTSLWVKCSDSKLLTEGCHIRPSSSCPFHPESLAVFSTLNVITSRQIRKIWWLEPAVQWCRHLLVQCPTIFSPSIPLYNVLSVCCFPPKNRQLLLLICFIWWQEKEEISFLLTSYVANDQKFVVPLYDSLSHTPIQYRNSRGETCWKKMQYYI